MKRLTDLSCILVGTFLFGPLGLLVGILILLDDRGPIFFRQERLGLGGKPFQVLKFRTMRDAKVTRMGKVLRSTGLDEVPQLLNVLKGEMSVVGPRPLTMGDVKRLGWTAPKFASRWKVAPGLTGLAQIHGGRGARHSFRLDSLYAKRCGLTVDLKIILLTLLMNFLGKGRVRARVSPAYRRSLGDVSKRHG
jgi:lipopolysaccharide/colanic/teichoic acid biosynthesis glycosyltransferase